MKTKAIVCLIAIYAAILPYSSVSFAVDFNGEWLEKCDGCGAKGFNLVLEYDQGQLTGTLAIDQMRQSARAQGRCSTQRHRAGH